ncbi:hypothetical protein ACSBR1_012673 [Camellia fascicularis]
MLSGHCFSIGLIRGNCSIVMVKIFFMLLPRGEDITWLVTFSKLLSSRSFINMRGISIETHPCIWPPWTGIQRLYAHIEEVQCTFVLCAHGGTVISVKFNATSVRERCRVG